MYLRAETLLDLPPVSAPRPARLRPWEWLLRRSLVQPCWLAPGLQHVGVLRVGVLSLVFPGTCAATVKGSTGNPRTLSKPAVRRTFNRNTADLCQHHLHGSCCYSVHKVEFKTFQHPDGIKVCCAAFMLLHKSRKGIKRGGFFFSWSNRERIRLIMLPPK